MAMQRRSGKLAVILHADVAGSTELVQKDEHIAHERIQNTFHRFGDIITEYHGRVRELRGDALLAEFQRASEAVSASLAFQEEQTRYIDGLEDTIRPIVRVGISMGEVVVADNTITGAGVVLAQRLEQLAEPGGIVVQGATYETVPRRLPFVFENLGDRQLKGFSESVRAYAVTLEVGKGIPPADKLKPGEEAPDLKLQDKPSIAVLPFDNMSGDPDQEYLADGISEDLITALSKIRSFMVITRNSTFQYKGKVVDVKQISNDLGVRYVLEGSVRTAGNRVRITAQLIDAENNQHIWAEKYDRELNDIFELQDEMTQMIIGALEPELDESERKLAINKPPDSLDAWASYQRGLWHLLQYEKDHHKEAFRFLQRAIELDPMFSSAYAYLSYTYYGNVIMGWADDPEWNIDQGFAAAKKALSLDDRDCAAYFALGRILMMRKEHDAAIRALEKSISLNPSFGKAYFALGMAFMLSDRLDEARKAVEQMERLSPRDPMLWVSSVCHACSDILAGDLEPAMQWAQKGIEQPNASGFWPHVMFAAACASLDRTEDAQKAIKDALNALPKLTVAHMEELLPVKKEGSLEPLLQALRKAGLPA